MRTANPLQAFLAMNGFLERVWERNRHLGELALFLGMIDYVPGHGSLDPAMWFDWLAWVKKVQTGELVPESTGARGALTAEMMQPLTAEQAYVAMFAFIEEYWNRIRRPADISDLLGLMRLTPGVGTTDPSVWKGWLSEFEKATAG